MCNLEVGQVLSLKLRFNNDGKISEGKHPYLIIDIVDYEVKCVEIAQLDTIKPYKLIRLSNTPIYCDNPNETVIDKNSYIQLDNKIQIEYFDDLIKYRRQPDKLSENKLEDVLEAYDNYHKTNIIESNKIVYITKEELLGYN